MEVKATAKFQRVSPRKARLVTDLITGKPADEAMGLLQNLAKGSAPLLAKVLRSAIANAENNYNMTLEDLYVKRAMADEGPRMKRIWMRGRGRRDTKLHRTAHLTVVVDTKEGA
ncbi:MAG: 50S ribosomal protein L22 [Chloroflexi bacterium]|nr:50S ribosomal protein L22 [Chloroflexota bacterium]